MIFPDYKNKKYGYVNLNLEAITWMKDRAHGRRSNPLLEPKMCQKMIENVHRKYNIDYSYGGWMEDRSFLWKGSYLEQWKTYTHLGVDINVPAGTRIAADFDGQVIKVDTDYPEEGGWGTRIILKHDQKPIYMIYAHLDRKVSCSVGDRLRKGDVFAKVGEAPYNGNWFPHLHLQTIDEKYFKIIEKNDSWQELDGYGADKEKKKDSLRFPDPMQYVSLR